VFGLAWLHVIEPRVAGSQVVKEGEPPVAARGLREVFGGPIIANPDLPYRLRNDMPLNAYDRDTFYGGDHRGYIDYPFATAEASVA